MIQEHAMSTSAPPIVEIARKHKSHDREFTDRERMLVEAWRDPKRLREELTALLWRRSTFLVVMLPMGMCVAGMAVVVVASFIQSSMSWTPWVPADKWNTAMLVGMVAITFFELVRTYYDHQIAALKFIGELEDRLASMESPSHE
jgi:hypothetical protein